MRVPFCIAFSPNLVFYRDTIYIIEENKIESMLFCCEASNKSAAYTTELRTYHSTGRTGIIVFWSTIAV